MKSENFAISAQVLGRSSARRARIIRRASLYAVLVFGGLLMMIPFFWMFLTSLKTRAEVFAAPPLSLPSGPHWDNYATMWNAFGDVTFGDFFLNSVVITLPAVIIPMHYFGPSTLNRFLSLIGDRYEVELMQLPVVALSRPTLPYRKVLVLPGG